MESGDRSPHSKGWSDGRDRWVRWMLAFVRQQECLVFEAFNELDRGQGTPIDDRQQLAELIGQIGRCAVDKVARGTIGA